MANIFQTTVESRDLAAGTHKYGFGGEVPASELWTGTELASLLGITEGTAQNINEPYLKWFVDGKVILKSKKPIRHTISWNHLNEKGLVYGDKIIEDKYGNQYKVRLMRGALTDPSKDNDPDRGAKYSEWNRLMLPIHEQAANKTWSNPQFVEPEIPSDWNINYTDNDLFTISSAGNGSYNWCQERPAPASTGRVARGYYGVSRATWFVGSYAYSHLGWSPVLELIQKPKLLLRHTKTGKIYTIKEGSFS